MPAALALLISLRASLGSVKRISGNTHNITKETITIAIVATRTEETFSSNAQITISINVIAVAKTRTGNNTCQSKHGKTILGNATILAAKPNELCNNDNGDLTIYPILMIY